MKIISVFDTTISDDNLGNEIIMDSVYKHLRGLFPADFFMKLPFMEITDHTISYLKRSDLIFFGGTNSLTSRMEKYKQWGVSITNFFKIKNVILMGLGWWQYEDVSISLYTKLLLKHTLNTTLNHAVRDAYTEKKLRQIGFTNILNTGCPTLWDLTPQFCATIPTKKSRAVIFTLTDYKKDIVADKAFVKIIQDNYDEIYFWIQGSEDLDYLHNQIQPQKSIKLVNPNLAAYDNLLKTHPSLDYVGTRLHAGIRALQFNRRSIIIGVDNRAIEMNKSFNLPVVSRNSLTELPDAIRNNLKTDIRIPLDTINKWKQQFYA